LERLRREKKQLENVGSDFSITITAPAANPGLVDHFKKFTNYYYANSKIFFSLKMVRHCLMKIM